MYRRAIRAVGRLAATAATIVLLGAVGPAGAARPGGPQGTLVFASDRSGTYQIYSIRADGSQLGQLTRGKAADTAPVFSPDGRLILFLRAPKQYASELWVMNADGSGQRRLAPSAYAPAWAPDSRSIAYVASGIPGPLVLARAAGSDRVVVPGRNQSPHWSPDGRRVAFTREVGDRFDLMVVGSDGSGLAIVRRRASAVGWSPRGEIAFTGLTGMFGAGIGLVGADGRGARLLLQSVLYGPAWSPDGSRLAFVGRRKASLHAATAEGRDVRDLPPQDVNSADAAVWSPDSRWLAISYAPNGSVLRELLLVAADGSSSRLLTRGIPRPWGTNYGPASWRPRGATPARLGGPPVAPLPSETVARTVLHVGAATIVELAADGGVAAVVVTEKPRICAGVEAWVPARRHVLRLERQGCLEHGSLYEPAHGLLVSRGRVAWLETDGGMTLGTTVVAATLDGRRVRLASEYADEGGAGYAVGPPVGHAGLVAFTVWHRCDEYAGGGPPPGDCPHGRHSGEVVDATLWRLGGRARCGSTRGRPSGPRSCTVVARADGQLLVLAVDGERIAARTDDGVRLLNIAGKVLRDFPVPASAAALSGAHLALRTASAVEVYDTGTGRLTSRFLVPKAVTLADLEGDILVTTSGETVTLRRLGDGRTTKIRTRGAAYAQLEPTGLYVAGAHRVTFIRMRDVLRRLGS